MDPHFEGVIFKTHAGELKRRLRHPHPPFYIVDTRSEDEYRAGHISGAARHTAADLAAELPAGTDAGTEFFVVGEELEDPRVRPLSRALMKLGARRVVELTGGMHEWRLAG